MLFSLDYAADPLTLEHPYFGPPEALVSDNCGTYVESDTTFSHTVTHEWSHGLAEVVTALLDAGMELTALAEHDSIPWNALPGRMSRHEAGEWRLTDRPWRLAASYTLQARRRGLRRPGVP